MAKRPNVLWIYTDQQRTDSIGCYGHNRWAVMRTPNTDELAGMGARFDNSFSNCPICVPSRVCIKTGLYPEDTGVYCNEGNYRSFRFERVPVTMPEVFARNGYRTGNFGKTHVPPGLEGIWQTDEHEGSLGRDLVQGVTPGDPGVVSVSGPGGQRAAGRYVGPLPYPPEALADSLFRWIERDDGPFFARLSLLQPHTPCFPPDPFATLYGEEDFPRAVLEEGTPSLFERRLGEVTGGREVSSAGLFLAHVYYYGLVAWIDHEVGRVLAFLKKRGLAENTIVAYDSDHGSGLAEWGSLFAKHSFAPHTHRVPRFIAWKGTIPAGQVRTDLTDCLDLARTLFSLCGIRTPSQFKGRDLFTDPAPEAIYSTIGFGFPDTLAYPLMGRGRWYDDRGWPRRSCIRTERWRFDMSTRIDGRATRPDEEDPFLADLQRDPRELTNLAGDPSHAEIARGLREKLLRHASTGREVPPEMVAKPARGSSKALGKE